MYVLSEEELVELYTWLDQIPLSRPKRNAPRDFSDGVLVAEVVRHYLPKMVEIHNYSSASSSKQKMDNWLMLNRKVFAKMNLELSEEVIRSISRCEPNSVETVLAMLRVKIDKSLLTSQNVKQRNNAIQRHTDEKPEAEQDIVSPGRNMPRPPVTDNKRLVKTTKIPEVVSRIQYEEKEQECLAKEETVKILQAKITRLEHLLRLKDMRIEEMTQKLDVLRPTGKLH